MHSGMHCECRPHRCNSAGVLALGSRYHVCLYDDALSASDISAIELCAHSVLFPTLPTAMLSTSFRCCTGSGLAEDLPARQGRMKPPGLASRDFICCFSAAESISCHRPTITQVQCSRIWCGPRSYQDIVQYSSYQPLPDRDIWHD